MRNLKEFVLTAMIVFLVSMAIYLMTNNLRLEADNNHLEQTVNAQNGIIMSWKSTALTEYEIINHIDEQRRKSRLN